MKTMLLLVKNIRQTDFFAIFQVDKLLLRLASYVHIIFHQILTPSNFYAQLCKYNVGAFCEIHRSVSPKYKQSLKSCVVCKVRRSIGKVLGRRVGLDLIRKVSFTRRMKR